MRTVIVSDCHVGRADAKTATLERFLFELTCDRLIFAGDLFDLWEAEPCHLRQHYSGLLWVIQRHKTAGVAVEYLLGNHDSDYLKDPVLPLEILPVVDDVDVYLGNGHKLAVIHGHQYDHYMKWYYPWYKLGSVISGWVARVAPRLSLSQLQNGEKYEKMVGKIHAAARRDYGAMGYSCVVMGHTHAPRHDLSNGGIEFVNSGDWVKHTSYVVVEDDEISLHHYKL